MQVLNAKQKEALGLLSIETILEYFDLMLYVHMAVLLNELFFPKTDPHTAALISAFAFCTTFVFRPIGALIFGWFGDNIGRKATVVITTFMMAVSCVIMANLPTYQQIGITAAWLVTLCRIIQGMTSMGEIIGAILYCTETIKHPEQFPAVVVLTFFVAFGGTCALSVATFVTSYGFNWRMGFWIGAGVALVGVVVRTALRETPDFIAAKGKLKIDSKNPSELMKQYNHINEKVSKKTVFFALLVECPVPINFYFPCKKILKSINLRV